MADVHGWTAPGWEGVRDAFERNFDKGLEVGAAFSAYHRGQMVVDLWGGLADAFEGRPWEEDTIALVYSTTKGVTATCANLLADEGRLDVDAPVAAYWPEFAAAGKADIPVSYLLSHRAGLAWVDGDMDSDDALAWEPVVRALEAQAPVWEPGTRHGYHATTYGWLVGEVVRRIQGKGFGASFRDLVGDPLGLEFHVGLPDSEEPRVARLHAAIPSTEGASTQASEATADPSEAGQHLENLLVQLFGPDAPLPKALFAPGNALADHRLWNSPRLHAAEIPSANGIGDARSVARMYAACIGEAATPDGGRLRLLSPEQLGRATEQHTEGGDLVILDVDLQFGLGYMLNRGVTATMGLGSEGGFGHFGLGGSMGWADPDAELAVGYIPNKMELGLTGDTRSYRLTKACHAALGAR
ncbi:MAG TPA: serine hydrolase domain-containing protein [Acidimicrobiales bacterium]|nr:serine hydrolase domain-containing protein [Acidimicrobiales bacterium]